MHSYHGWKKEKRMESKLDNYKEIFAIIKYDKQCSCPIGNEIIGQHEGETSIFCPLCKTWWEPRIFITIKRGETNEQ